MTSHDKESGEILEGYEDAGETPEPPIAADPFLWLPSGIYPSACGFDRGAGNRLQRICPVGTIWGVAMREIPVPDDRRQKEDGSVWEWFALEADAEAPFRAVRLNPKTSEIDDDPDNPLPPRFRSEYLYLPKGFHAGMRKIIDSAGPQRFRLDVAIRPRPGIDGSWLARVTLPDAPPPSGKFAALEQQLGLPLGFYAPRDRKLIEGGKA